MPEEVLRIVALISGRGSNLQSLIDACQQDLPAEIHAVISNVAGVQGLDRAKSAGIPTHIVAHGGFESRASFDAALIGIIDGYRPDLVVLAGFMRILTADFVQHYAGRLINIHPSLLPKYQGLNTHARAITAGETEHGASVHFVTEELDGGPVIIQARVQVLPDDTPDTLAARVLEQEHVIYPEAVRMIADGRARKKGVRDPFFFLKEKGKKGL